MPEARHGVGVERKGPCGLHTLWWSGLQRRVVVPRSKLMMRPTEDDISAVVEKWLMTTPDVQHTSGPYFGHILAALTGVTLTYD